MASSSWGVYVSNTRCAITLPCQHHNQAQIGMRTGGRKNRGTTCGRPSGPSGGWVWERDFSLLQQELQEFFYIQNGAFWSFFKTEYVVKLSLIYCFIYGLFFTFKTSHIKLSQK